MRKIKKSKINKKRFIPFIFFVVSTVILIIMLTQYIHQKNMIKDLKSNTSILKNKSKELQQEIDRLTKEIEEVNSLEYIEKKAREDLGMIKKGEKIYVDDETNKETQNE
ncbi:FtsB family cell division protein [Helcococcus kunzii]|uniref:Cell division protein FtsL n=1 Tax=Helcococcus kunzii ATCC 51366 TaxID=883114 RepID=H3NNM7_9FIRM|nr:septum formation initiator family protein [Helcococcus kunzii]EHR34002.1 cell division protein FtsL [Helcococcus kunzii ATCC 51366]MCT1795610.1 septum formation initiator family protein [Helcococcus kunzii]MCT1988824.1 septum formation initiator family protein [Helcococcus kunzii]QUY64852.1 septum formation initiator family protein [Helcococcus kunzii]QZO77294.1 septum formation initiator family protein [Helcococcus kunzii]